MPDKAKGEDQREGNPELAKTSLFEQLIWSKQIGTWSFHRVYHLLWVQESFLCWYDLSSCSPLLCVELAGDALAKFLHNVPQVSNYDFAVVSDRAVGQDRPPANSWSVPAPTGANRAPAALLNWEWTPFSSCTMFPIWIQALSAGKWVPSCLTVSDAPQYKSLHSLT